uniref:Persephin n=1 Tax=Varanus komodoensis TaxID=61221 RepID=A0A8D2L9L8_VARKO
PKGQSLLLRSLLLLKKDSSLHAVGTLNSPRGLPPGPFPASARGRPKRERPEEQECHLQSMLVRIKDLGLGYNSEETILFKYCTGSCSMVRTNHDLTLSVLLQKSEISALGDPCCRPTRYENVAFLDDSNQWHEVEKLSASSCGCVG